MEEERQKTKEELTMFLSYLKKHYKMQRCGYLDDFIVQRYMTDKYEWLNQNGKT